MFIFSFVLQISSGEFSKGSTCVVHMCSTHCVHTCAVPLKTKKVIPYQQRKKTSGSKEGKSEDPEAPEQPSAEEQELQTVESTEA